MERQTYVIGDVHGCADELRTLVGQLPLTSGDRIVFVGDYIDRGPCSKDVIDVILELATRYEVVPLLGNHEAMLLDFIDRPSSPFGGAFIMNGGSATLASYGDDKGEYTIPPAHERFYRELKLHHEDDEHFFVHAGVPDLPLTKLDERRHRMTMLWIRDPFLRSKYPWAKTVVHGHTPVPTAEVHARRINVDSGCVFNGLLSALELKSGKIWAVQRQTHLEPTFLRDRASGRVAVRFRASMPVIVEVAGGRHELETVDFNDFGALVRHADSQDRELFRVGERLEGVLGPPDQPQARFRGVVLRTQKDDQGVCYALKFLSPPRAVEHQP